MPKKAKKSMLFYLSMLNSSTEDLATKGIAWSIVSSAYEINYGKNVLDVAQQVVDGKANKLDLEEALEKALGLGLRK